MNSKTVVIIGVVASFAATLILDASVMAQAAQTTLSDTHIRQIQQNCKAATRVIQQIHANDGPLRVNRGQVYDSISSKLMTPLNSRLIINKLDASAMVKVTAQYEKALSDFRENYRRYDNKMSDVLTVNCVKDPQHFYDELVQARHLRSVVHGDIVKVNGLIDEYGASFSAFRERFSDDELKGVE